VYLRVRNPHKRLPLEDPGLSMPGARLYLRPSRLFSQNLRLGETGISVPHLGMFGNSMAAFMPVVARAMSHKIDHVVVHHESVLSSPDEFGKRGVFRFTGGTQIWLDVAPIFPQNPIFALLGDKALTASTDTDLGTLAWSEISGLLLGPDERSCEADGTLVIHLRGGDVYRGSRHLLNHGQPPLSYYELVLDHQVWTDVVIVHQGTDMPVLAPLLSACEVRGLPVRTQSQSLMEDLSALLKASTIVAGRGSFVPQVVGLSRCVKTVYTFENGFGLSVPKAGITTYRVYDAVGDFGESILKVNWKNTPAQRELMITYPVQSLGIEKQ
jgi:hypothetical protein